MSLDLRRLTWALALTITGGAAGLFLGDASAGTAQWELNGNLSSSTGQAALEAVGYPGAAGAPGVTFTSDLIGGVTAQVAQLAEGTALVVRHGFPHNGGGAYLNNYTLIMDVKLPSAIDWTSLYQTNEAYDDVGGAFNLADSNDGDWFVNPDGGIGISGNYGGAIVSNTWYRLALVVDHTAGTFTSYIDGVQVQQNTGLTVDDRWALYTTTDPDPYDWFLLFADETGVSEMSAVTLGSFQFRDVAASAEEIAALGGPTAFGIGGTAPTCDQGFFAEDFEGYADDAALAAGGWQVVQTNAPLEDAQWTLTNPGARRNPPTADGSPSTGKFIISDSDNAGSSNTPGTGMSHDLISPAFSTAGGSSVWVHASCNAQLNNDAGNATAIFDVDVSSDGGATWTTAFRRIAPGTRAAPAPDNTNADGFFGRLAVDISAPAADKPSVQIRFRHFEPTDDWWVALDDISVSCQAPPAGGNCTILSNQDFTGGLGAMTAVSLAGNTGNETWSTGDKGNRYVAGGVSGRGVNRLNHPSASKDFAILESEADPDGPEDEYLRTPNLNCTLFSSVFVHWKSETVLDNAATQEVLASLDGGVTYPIVIFRYNVVGGASNALFDEGEESFYAERVFEVPGAGLQPSVTIAFHYMSAAGNERFWAIDDVSVTGSAAVCDPRDCGQRAFAAAYDAATNTVTGTWNTLPGDAGFRVLEGARVVADNLPGTATSFIDSAPPRGGEAVQYTLESLVEAPGGGLVKDRDCLSQEVQTFLCPGALTCSADQETKQVTLNWVGGVNLDSTGYEVRRNGAVIATVGLGASSYTDSPPLAAGAFGVSNYELLVAGGDASKCIASTCRSILSPGRVCFADDFEAYTNDVDFELNGGWFRVDEVPSPARPGESATWTVLNPGGRSNPATFDGKASTGRFAVSDSDAGGGDNGVPGSGNSNDLWSPAFSTEGKSAVWLHMDTSAELNNNGKVVFDVDVSTDGGGIWTNVFRRAAPARTEAPPAVSTSNADGFFGRLDIDLSALAADKPAAQFRIRSFEPSDDWWVAVDNVIVDDVPALSGGGVTLLEEDFAAGLGSMAALSLVGNVDPKTWTTTDVCPRSVVTLGGTFPVRDGRGVHRLSPGFAIAESECNPGTPQDELLLTPALDCSLAAAVYLHWKSEVNATPDALQEVLVSLDGGDTFLAEPLFSYNGGGLLEGGEDPFYAERVFSVPAAALQGNVAFAFHYKSGGGQFFWAVDDVKVTATSICTSPFTVAIAGEAQANVGDTVHLTSSTTATGPATYAWQVVSGPGSIAGSDSGSEVDITMSATGTVEVKLAVTDSCGAGQSATFAITVVQPGGGQIPGDCNQDGKVDLSDAVCVLGFLFLGNPTELPCGDGTVDAAANRTLLNWNNDALLDLSDAVSTLTWLFSGGSPHTLDANGDGTTCVSIDGCEEVCTP